MCLVASVDADEPLTRVYVLTSPTVPLRPAFVESLRIQLADLGIVQEGPPLADRALTDRVARAAELVETTGATMAVWMERAGEEAELILFAVSRHRERALVQLVKIPAASESEVDRLVSLKIGELTEAGLTALSSITRARVTMPKPEAVAGTSPATHHWLVEIGIDGSTGAGSTGSQAGALIGSGMRWRVDRLDFETLATLRTGSELESTGTKGHVIVDELDANLGGRVLVRWRDVAAGGRVELGARYLDALGIGTNGRTGTMAIVAPVVGFGVEGRWRITDVVELRGRLGVEVMIQRPLFVLDGVPTADIGRGRAMAGISVVLAP
jgi:hypothetical protein